MWAWNITWNEVSIYYRGRLACVFAGAGPSLTRASFILHWMKFGVILFLDIHGYSFWVSSSFFIMVRDNGNKSIFGESKVCVRVQSDFVYSFVLGCSSSARFAAWNLYL